MRYLVLLLLVLCSFTQDTNRRKWHRPAREWCLLLNDDSDGTIDGATVSGATFSTYTRTGGRTLSLWVRVPVLPADGEAVPVFNVGGADGTGTDAAWTINVRASSAINGGDATPYFNLISIIQNSTSRVAWWKTTPIVANTWYNLIVQTSGTAWSARVNNVAQATTMTTNNNNGFWFNDNLITAPRVACLGCAYTAGVASNGSAADKRVYVWQLTMWNKALTGTEMGTLYNLGAGMHPRFHTAYANLTDYWPFGETEDVDANASIFPVYGGATWTTQDMTNAANRVLAP